MKLVTAFALSYGHSMSPHRRGLLWFAALISVGCKLDERTLQSTWASGYAGTSGRGSCITSASHSCSLSSGGSGSLDGSDGALGACNDLDRNGILDATESLAQNPTFDYDSEDWEPEAGVGVAWDPVDVCGSGASGSLNVTYQKSGSVVGASTGAAVQCISAVPGRTYALSATFFLRSPGSQGAVGIAFFPTSDCTGARLAGNDSSSATEAGVWISASVTAAAPSAAVSLAVRLTAGRSEWDVTMTQADILVDGVLIHGAP